MKKILKPLISVIAIGAISLSVNTDKNISANNIANTCEYDSASKGNPDYSTMNCLLTETALIYDVPPEIVKAIAEGESGNWRHFDQNGKAIVTADNGIGIMQITNQADYNQDRLKSDLVYNIQAGVETLDKMFKRKDLPSINGGERDVLEHWYFAVMAYNGTKPVNSPIIQATDERNANAYQEKIFGIVEKMGLIDLEVLPFSSEDFQYDSNSKENIKFSSMNYPFELPLTKSKHAFETNQKVNTTTNANLRSRPTTDSPLLDTLREGETITITGPFEYDEVSTKKNHFVWYPVKRSDGTKGYVASSYLNDSTPTPKPLPPVTSASNDVVVVDGGKVVNGRTLVPIRVISEEFNSKVDWNQKSKTVTINDGTSEVVLTANSKKITVNGQPKIIDVPVRVENGKTLVPLVVASPSGSKASWDQNKKQASISFNGKTVIVNVNPNN
ncbi:stalk domain-containing protein [Solibacillus daqui]|uniref:stalk domain-containing protein n=1 Tax=Solibacillus daqui TaxID=2912187 RepID=UPI0023672EEB|nr:stalk domain-containing protein [Solibacillus daqui]